MTVCQFIKVTFSGTAITDRHSATFFFSLKFKVFNDPSVAQTCSVVPQQDFDTTIFQLRAHLAQISWSIGSEKSFGRAAGGSPTFDFLHERQTPYPLGLGIQLCIAGCVSLMSI